MTGHVIRRWVPAPLKRRLKKFLDKDLREFKKQEAVISKLPRFTTAQILFLRKKFTMVDGASFLFMKKEIFDQQIYRFNADNDTPYIVDCGANIGLSVIYF